MTRVAGLGFRGGAGLHSLAAALDLAEARGGMVTALASTRAKAATAELQALGRLRGLAVIGVDVQGIETPTTSARITAMHGTGSVAEAAALVAAGPGARITVARLTAPDGMATAAIAEVGGDQE